MPSSQLVELTKGYFITSASNSWVHHNLKSLLRLLTTDKWTSSTQLWFTAFVPPPPWGELISQSDPLADTARMHLSHCQQLISLRLLVKFACYAFDTFKLPESHLAWAEGWEWKGKNRGKGSLWNPPELLLPSIMAVRAAGLLFYSGSSQQSSTSSETVMEVQASAARGLIRGCKKQTWRISAFMTRLMRRVLHGVTKVILKERKPNFCSSEAFNHTGLGKNKITFLEVVSVGLFCTAESQKWHPFFPIRKLTVILI